MCCFSRTGSMKTSSRIEREALIQDRKNQISYSCSRQSKGVQNGSSRDGNRGVDLIFSDRKHGKTHHDQLVAMGLF